MTKWQIQPVVTSERREDLTYKFRELSATLIEPLFYRLQLFGKFTILASKGFLEKHLIEINMVALASWYKS